MWFAYDKFYTEPKMFNRFTSRIEKKNVLLHLPLILPTRKKTLKMLVKLKIYDPLRQSENFSEYPRKLFKPQIRNHDAKCSRSAQKQYAMNTCAHLEYSTVFNHGH